MTIIEPGKNIIKINGILLILITLVIFGALFSVYIYNQTVSLRYQLKQQEEEYNILQVVNAELKNKLYGVLSEQNYAELVKSMGLVKDNKPIYLREKWAGFALHY